MTPPARMEPAKLPRRPPGLPANLLLALASLVFTFLLAEFGARLLLTQFAPKRIFDKYASLAQLNARYGQARLTDHRYLGFYPQPGYTSGANRHNALGYRGEEIAVPKPAGVFRIVCFGGSTTYSTAVEDYRDTYPFQLQTYLHGRGYPSVEVVNAGVPSFTSWETLINFEFRALDLDPDLIIIYHAVNDVDARLVWPPEAYQGDNSGYVRRRGTFQRSWLEESTVLRIALIYFGLAQPHIDLWRNFIETPGSYIGGEFQGQVKRGVYPSGLFAKTSVLEILRRNPPIYFERNLRTLTAIAQDNGVRVLFVTFTFSPLFTENPRASSPEFAFGIGQNNAVVRALAEETGAGLFDFAAVMPPDREYFADGIHFSAAGNALRARLIGEYLTAGGWIPAPAAAGAESP